MSFTALVVDSTAGLPQETVERYGIGVVPLYIRMDGEVYRDGVDVTPEEFYERLPHCSSLPTTSQPSAGDFVTAYRELVERGASGIISIHLSAGISGTVNSAQLAAQEMGDLPIDILDTRSASGAHRMTAEAAAMALAAGASQQEAVAAAQRVIDQQRIIFSVDTLEYLYKGGRIGGAAALVGSLLQFKPVLHMPEGRIDALERVRTSSRALARIAEIMAEWQGREEPMRAIIAEAACAERAETLLGLLRDNLNIVQAEVTPLTPVLGAHVGPGTVGLCCCPASLCRTDGEAAAG